MLDLHSETVATQDPLWQEGWADGLPVVPPTRHRVEEMLSATSRNAQDVLGLVAPNDGAATVEKVAINAVMAGCLPKCFPVVMAAVEAAADPAFNLNGVQATTHNAAPLIVVSGPVAREIGMNAEGNCFGQGNRANATIGRALRLILLNVGGGYPHTVDKSTFGHPGKYTYCIAENDVENPWEPLHLNRGITASESAVTVLACEAPHSVSDHVSADGRGILTTIADSLATMGSNNMYAMGEAIVVAGPEHASTLREDGWDRRSVQEFVYEKARRSIRELSRGGMFSPEFRRAYWPRWIDETDPDEMVPVVRSPSDILLTIAGGTGKFSLVIPGWGDFGTKAVSKIVERSKEEAS